MTADVKAEKPGCRIQAEILEEPDPLELDYKSLHPAEETGRREVAIMMPVALDDESRGDDCGGRRRTPN